MSSRPSSRSACLRAVVVVFALVCSLFAVSPAHAAGTSISGKVTKPSGNALSESVVDLYREYSDGYYYEKSVKTRTDGTYTFSSLPRDHYVVGFGAESRRYAAEFWNNSKEFKDAREISLGSSSVTGVNARLAIGATVSGQVLSEGPDAHGVADAEVAAYRQDDDGEWTFDKSVQTASDGTYTIGGLNAGRFTLEFNPPTDGPDADLALEYWPNQRVFNLENFYLELGETKGGFDAALAPGGRISGRVTGPDGEPIAGAPVFSLPSNNGLEVANIAITEDDGTYVMKGLSAGQHRLEFYGPYSFDNPYISEYWDDQGIFKEADRITVTAGTTSAGKDAQLAIEGTAIVNTARPTLSGTAKAGEILTADPGTWSVGNVAFRYQWLADGSPIEEVARASYRVRGADVGKSISVRVTASRPDHTTGTATSASTAPAAKGTFTLKAPPTVVAERVGTKARVVPGTWSAGPTWEGFLDYTPIRDYQVLVDGVEVPGATAQSFDITPDMLGKRISYREEVSLPGWIPTSATTEQSAPIEPGRLCHGSPSIVGDVIAGEPARSSTGFGCHVVGQPIPTITFAYRWFVDGIEIPGAQSAEFTPPVEDTGKKLTVEVTGSSPGYTTVSGVSDPVYIEPRDTIRISLIGPAPSITGRPSIGSTMTAEPSEWRPQPSSFAYQWLADGVPIDGATGSTFKPTTTEGGKRISVKVTASRSGYAPGTATSAATDPVLTSTPFGAPQNLEATKTTVTYIDLAWTKVDGAVGYRIYRGVGSGTRTKLEVGDVTSARIRNLKPNTTYSIDIAALKSDGTRSPYSPRINVRTMALVPPTNFTVAGQTSTSLTLTWTKVPGVPKYRIWHGIGSGTRTKLEVGNVSTATITGLKPGTTYSLDIASLLADGTRSSYTPRIDGTTAD